MLDLLSSVFFALQYVDGCELFLFMLDESSGILYVAEQHTPCPVNLC